MWQLLGPMLLDHQPEEGRSSPSWGSGQRHFPAPSSACWDCMLIDGFDKSLLHWDNKCNVHALYSSCICLACKEQGWSKQCTCVVFIMHRPCSQGTSVVKTMYMLYSSCICLARKEQVWSKQCTCCIHHASALLARNKLWSKQK